MSSEYAYYSPYAFSGNRVIDSKEIEGLEPAQITVYWNPFNSTPVYPLVLKPGNPLFDVVYSQAMNKKWDKKGVKHFEGGEMVVTYSDYNDKESMKTAKWTGYKQRKVSKSWNEMTLYEKVFETTPTQREMHGWGNSSGRADPLADGSDMPWEEYNPETGMMEAGSGQKLFWSVIAVEGSALALVGGGLALAGAVAEGSTALIVKSSVFLASDVVSLIGNVDDLQAVFSEKNMLSSDIKAAFNAVGAMFSAGKLTNVLALEDFPTLEAFNLAVDLRELVLYGNDKMKSETDNQDGASEGSSNSE